LKVSGFPSPPHFPAFTRIPPEFYQPSLIAMEFQGKFPQPFLQSGEEPHGVILKLETRHKVVRIDAHTFGKQSKTSSMRASVIVLVPMMASTESIMGLKRFPVLHGIPRRSRNHW
jgi:hypothetical protein